MATHPSVDFLGRLNYQDLRDIWGCSSAIFFPTSVELFGYPLAEARVSGHPVIALDTAQNREIAGAALCGFTSGKWNHCYMPSTLRWLWMWRLIRSRSRHIPTSTGC